MTSPFAESQVAEIVFTNGNIRTVDRANPRAEAVAILGSKILAVGTSSGLKQYVGKSTKVIDMKGKLMLPGFIDNHTHFSSGGFQLQNVDLRYARNEGEFARLIKERAEKFPTRWISGGDWDHDNWPGGNLPTKDLIDKYSANTPVFVNRYDGHMALANSVAMKLAGVTRETPNPPGGTIVRDHRTGEPTGVLKDKAMGYVYKIMPDPSFDELLDAIRLALAEARKLGVTSIQDISSSSDLKAYQTLEAKGELTARFYCRLPIGQWEQLAKAGTRVPFGNEWVCTGSLKAFADGSLGSSTALFFEPFREPSERGFCS